MSKIIQDVIYAGQTTEGHAGIDGEFMVENKMLFAMVITTDNDGAIMLHPGFNMEKAEHLIPMIEALNRQAVEVLRIGARGNGQVH